MAGQAERIDRWTGADTSAIEDLRRRVTEFQEKTTRVPQLQDLIMIVAIGFGGMWIATLAAQPLEQWAPFFSATVWKMVVVTALAVALSFSPARQLEGAGAARGARQAGGAPVVAQLAQQHEHQRSTQA